MIIDTVGIDAITIASLLAVKFEVILPSYSG